MDENFVIKLKHICKTFRLPVSRKATVSSYFVNPFERVQWRVYPVLRDISFGVRKNEFFSIIGRNGVGKSTLLKLIAGIYEPDDGQIRIGGSLVPFLELGVGFNFELTARENVFLNGILLGLRRREVAASIDDIFDFAELEDFKEVPVKNFSSGMQVRLSFSIAMKVKSDILVLDEVLAVGDVEFQNKCYKYFDSIKGKKTIIFVSHDLESVLRYSDRVLYLKGDNTYKIGRAEDIISMYKRDVA